MADFYLNPAIELVDNTQLCDRKILQRSKLRNYPYLIQFTHFSKDSGSQIGYYTHSSLLILSSHFHFIYYKALIAIISGRNGAED